MNRTPVLILAFVVLLLPRCQQSPPPNTDTHALAEEVHHKPEVARKIIADVIAEPHGVALIAEELSKNELAAGNIVDELMKNPTMAAVISDRCAAADIARQVGSSDSKNNKR